MDKLLECVDVFEKMCENQYKYYLDNGQVIHLIINSKNLYHLLGFHKLVDIPIIMRTKGKALVKAIKKGIITINTISKSSYFTDIEDRINNFKALNELVIDKVVIDFDNTLIQTKLKSDLIFFREDKGIYLHFCLGKDKLIYYPETFIVHCNDYYVRKQVIANVIKIEILNSFGNKVINTIVHNVLEKEVAVD